MQQVKYHTYRNMHNITQLTTLLSCYMMAMTSNSASAVDHDDCFALSLNGQKVDNIVVAYT